MPWRSPCRLHLARALATPTQLPISEICRWIMEKNQLMKHDETWHLQKPTDITNPPWESCDLVTFGFLLVYTNYCNFGGWPCSVLATLGCRLAAARPGDWLEAIKGLSTLVICVSAARWSVWVSLSSLCNRDCGCLEINSTFNIDLDFCSLIFGDIEWNRTNIGVLPTS